MYKSPLFLAGLGGIVIIVAIVANIVLWEDNIVPVRAPQTEQAGSEQSPEAITPPAPVKAVKKPAQEMAGRIPTADPVLTPQLSATPPPSFDVVRVSPDGSAVIAGRAKAGSQVVILDNGQFVGQLKSDPNGEWVFVPEKPFLPGNRQLELQMRVEGRAPIPSDDVVVLVVPEPNKDIAGRKTDKPTQALALKFSKKGGASTVLQKPSGNANSTVLMVDTIDYDETGRLMISGRAQPGASVFVYLNNTIIGKALVDNSGGWRIRPDNRIKPGLYTLRADQVATDGKVIARVSMPFSRAEPMEEKTTKPFIIVQPGNSLWRMARTTYGSGFEFTTIYEANKEQIKDPNLIFPGQVFALPSDNQ